MNILSHKTANRWAQARLGTTVVLMLALTACASTDTRRSTGQTIDDASISSRVKTALLADDTTGGMDIEIEVDRGRVQLNGFVNSAEEKARAEKLAKETRGVMAVDNNLDIADDSRSVGEYIDDKVLLARVNGALAKDPKVSTFDIEVEVNRGSVQLGGYVDKESERRAAGDAAQRVKGVTRVSNKISVRNSN